MSEQPMTGVASTDGLENAPTETLLVTYNHASCFGCTFLRMPRGTRKTAHWVLEVMHEVRRSMIAEGILPEGNEDPVVIVNWKVLDEPGGA